MSAVRVSNNERIRIFVRLLGEGTEVTRPTEAINLGNGSFQVLSTPDYDPEDEVWEFPPGSTVRCETRRDPAGEYLLATKAMN
jgi:hypothetical protein